MSQGSWSHPGQKGQRGYDTRDDPTLWTDVTTATCGGSARIDQEGCERWACLRLRAVASVRDACLNGAHHMNGLEGVLRRWCQGHVGCGCDERGRYDQQNSSPSELWKMARPSCRRDKRARRQLRAVGVPSCVVSLRWGVHGP